MKISKDKMVDLSYLKDLSFSELEINAPGFKNIAAINGNKRLISLAVKGDYRKLYTPAFGTDFPGYITNTMDLGALNNLPGLIKLVLGLGIRTIDFLKNLPLVTELKIEDAESVMGIETLVNLRKLTIGECSGLDALKPLLQLKLTSLDFFCTRFEKKLWLDFMEFVKASNNVEINVEKYRNIPKKRVMALEEMEGITDFYFTEDAYYGNSFSFKIGSKSQINN